MASEKSSVFFKKRVYTLNPHSETSHYRSKYSWNSIFPCLFLFGKFTQNSCKKATENIFEGLDSEVKTRIPGRSALALQALCYMYVAYRNPDFEILLSLGTSCFRHFCLQLNQQAKCQHCNFRIRLLTAQVIFR